MDLHAKVLGLYCERVGEGFWDEPVNALTNLAFLLAAWLSWRVWREEPRARGDRLTLVLILLTAAIGLGSFAFHTFATRWALLADTIPILIYMLTATGAIFRYGLGWSRLGVAALLVVFIASMPTLMALLPPTRFQFSQGYWPAWFALVGAAWLVHAPDKRRHLTGTAGLFAISLVFRTLDRPLCPYAPFGTHFLWHLCNALVLFRVNTWLLYSRLDVAAGGAR